MESLGTIISAFVVKKMFDDKVEDQTRIMLKEFFEAEEIFVGCDLDDKEQSKEIMAWIRNNPKYDFIGIQNGPSMSQQLIILEKETDKFVSGRKVKIKDIEGGEVTIEVSVIKLKDGADPYEMGKKVRQATEKMEANK